MTTNRRLALVWIVTILEISVLAVLIATLMCPTRLALEQLRGVPADPVLPALRGEARCWLVFGFMTVVSVALAAWASVSITRRARMES